jgi:hypothetical protein
MVQLGERLRLHHPRGRSVDLFVHFSAISDEGYRNLEENLKVEYDVTQVNRPAGDERTARPPDRRSRRQSAEESAGRNLESRWARFLRCQSGRWAATDEESLKTSSAARRRNPVCLPAPPRGAFAGPSKPTKVFLKRECFFRVVTGPSNRVDRVSSTWSTIGRL